MEEGFIHESDLYELFQHRERYCRLDECWYTTIKIIDKPVLQPEDRVEYIRDSKGRDEKSFLYMTKGELMRLVRNGTVLLKHYKYDVLKLDAVDYDD